MRFLTAPLTLLLAMGCQNEPKSSYLPDAPSAAERGTSAALQDSNQAEPDDRPQSASTTPPPTDSDDGKQSHGEEEPPEESSAEPNDQTEIMPTRDLAQELTVAVGNVQECIREDAFARSDFEVSATALVLPSGTVTQPAVRGRGLSQAERHCIGARVRAAELQPLDDSTSQRITTSIRVDLTAPEPTVSGYRVGPDDPVLRNVRDPLPKRPEVAPSGRPIQEPTSRPVQEPTSRPIQEPNSRRVRGPQPRPIDRWDVDQSSKDWR